MHTDGITIDWNAIFDKPMNGDLTADPKPPSPYPPMRTSEYSASFTSGGKEASFFHFQLRDWIQITVLGVVAMLFLFQRQSDVTTLSNNVSNLTATVSSLAVTVENLKKNSEGNTSDIRAERDRNIEQDRRISTVEQQLATLVPDLREVKTKLNFVADLLDQQRTKR